MERGVFGMSLRSKSRPEIASGSASNAAKPDAIA